MVILVVVLVGVLPVQNACREPARHPVERIRSTGLAQLTGSAGVNTSSIRKSPSGCERDTSSACVVQRERRGSLTNQRGPHAKTRIGPDTIAAGKQKALALDLDAPVDFDLGLELVDSPGLSGRVDGAYNVLGHIRKGSVCVHDARRGSRGAAS